MHVLRARAWLRDLDVAIAATLGLACTALYALTLCPTVYWYDSAEFSAHAATLGVPHPPGYPLYTMIAHLFTRLPFEPAFGVNLMSLVFGVAGVLLLYGLARLSGAGRAGALTGALVLATARTHWANAVVAEVYTPGLVFTLGTFALLGVGSKRERPRLLVAAALVAGLGVGMHMSIATLGLGYVWLTLSHGAKLERLAELRGWLTAPWRPRLQVAFASLGAVLLGLSVFMYIPFRRFGDEWDERDWIGFVKNATGGKFKNKFMSRYDFGERLELVGSIFVDNLLPVGVALAVVGLGLLVARRPRWGIGLTLGAAGNVWWFFNYSVHDLDVFYLPAIAIACIGIAIAIDEIGDRLASRRPAWGRLRWAALLLPVLLGARNYPEVDLSEATDARTWAQAACTTLPPDAKVILYSRRPEWEYYAVFLYVQQALGQCQDVEILKSPRRMHVARMLNRGVPVYAFFPVDEIEEAWEVTPEGPLWRIALRPTSMRKGKLAGDGVRSSDHAGG